MGSEYIFFPAYIDNKTKKIHPVMFGLDGKPECIMWRSRSFIDGDFFTNNFRMITREDIADEYADFFCGRYENLSESENAPTYTYLLTDNDIYQNGQNDGLVSGYALVEELGGYYQSDERQEYYCWHMTRPIPVELYAELPPKQQKRYAKFAMVDRYSSDYICGHLAEIISDIILPFNIDGTVCVLMMYSF